MNEPLKGSQRDVFVEAARKAALLVVSVAVTLLLLEAGFRVYTRVFRPRMVLLDPKLGWRHAPGVRRTFVNEHGEQVQNILNEYGHRGPSRPEPRTAGTRRILTLGDSFAEGWAVDDLALWSALVEHGQPGLEIINTAVGGYGTVQQYLYLAEDGMRYRPDVVMVMFYENDLTDNVRANLPEFGPRPYGRVTGGAVEIVDDLDPAEFRRFLLPVPLRLSLHRHSHVFYFVNRAYQLSFDSRMREMILESYRKTDPESIYRIFFNALDRMSDVLEQQQIPLVVVQIPSREDVKSGTSRIAERLLPYCQEKGLHCLSLMDRFTRETAEGKRLYFAVDIHWTREGHAVAADEILRYLRSSGLPITGDAPRP